MHVTRALRVTGALLAAGLLYSSPAFAQSSGVLMGTVTDASNKQAAVDVVVTATSPNLQGEQIVVTDDKGQYRLSQLPPGLYTLRFEKESFRPFARGDIEVRLNRTLRVNVELLPEGVQAEDIIVVGRAPIIDVGSATTGVNINSDFIRQFAVANPGAKGGATRSFETLALVAPGANADQFGVSLAGATSPENQFFVDGLSVNNPAYGLLGTPLSVEFIQDVNVITGGYLPEFGRATGGVLNAVTKSGSNEFHGSVFGTWTPGFLAASPKDVRRAGVAFNSTSNIWNIGDFGAELGGPIIKDTLWFYAGLAPSITRLAIDRTFTTVRLDDAGEPILEDGKPVTDEIPGTHERRFADMTTVQYIGKLTYLISSDHTLSLSVSGAPSSSGGNGSYGFKTDDWAPDVSTTTGINYVNVEGDYSAMAYKTTSSPVDVALKLASAFLEKRLLFDTTVGWHHQNVTELPSDGSRVGSMQGLAGVPGIRWQQNNPGYHNVADLIDPRTPGYDQIVAACAGLTADGGTVCPISQYFTGGPGFIRDYTVDRVQAKSIGTFLFEAAGHHVLKAGVDLESLVMDSTRGYSGRVRFSERLAGGRGFSADRNFGYLTGPDEAVILDAIHSRSRSFTAGGFVQDSWNVLDVVTVNAGVRYDAQMLYGGDGQLGMTLPNQWSPRIGAIYDPTQEGRSKIFGNYARYYESVPLNIIDRGFGNERALFWRKPLTGCDPANNPHDPLTRCQDSGTDFVGNPQQSANDPNARYGVVSGSKFLVDPDIKPQSSDEIVLGGEYEVINNGRAGVTYTKRFLNNVIEDMSRDEASTYFIGNPGRGLGKDFPKATRDYDAVTLFFTKAFSDLWMAQASYTWSKLRGNYAGLFRPETGQLDPNGNSTYDLISLLANQTGPLPGDRTHSIQLYGAKEFIIKKGQSVNLGVNYNLRSGTPINYFGYHSLYGPDETNILPRGAGGRTAWENQIDTRVGYNVALSPDHLLTVGVDIFNLFNFQAATRVDESYTQSEARPIEGGTEEDLDALQTIYGEPVTAAEVNPNFKRPIVYQIPRNVRLSVRVSF